MSNDSTEGERPQTTTTVQNLDSRGDVGFNVGGYIVRDRLWFFGAYNPVFDTTQTRVIRTLTAPGSPALGSEIPTDQTRHLTAVKLTYRLGGGQRLVGAFNADPATREGAIFAVSGPESTWDAKQKTGAVDPSLTYDASFGGTFNLRAIVGRHAEKSDYSGAGKLTPLTIDQTVSPNIRTGGFGGAFQDSEFTRDIFKVDATKFLAGHELKAGVDWEMQDSSIDRYAAGGGMINYRLTTSGGVIYHRHRFFVERPGARLRRGRAVDLAAGDPARDRAEDRQQLVLPAGQLAGDLELHDQRRHPLGAPEDRRPRRRDGDRPHRQLGAAPRSRLGLRAERPQQAVRELGPLLREHPDGHQHPGVRRRGDLLLLQLRPERR